MGSYGTGSHSIELGITLTGTSPSLAEPSSIAHVHPSPRIPGLRGS